MFVLGGSNLHFGWELTRVFNAAGEHAGDYGCVMHYILRLADLHDVGYNCHIHAIQNTPAGGD